MKSLTIKIIFMAVGISVVVALILTAAFAVAFKSMVDDQSALVDRTLRESFDRSVRWEVETAISVLGKIDALRRDGTLTDDLARDVATKILRDMRYDKEGYFWADTTDGTNVVLRGQAQEGRNRMAAVDAKGFSFIKAIVEAGTNGGGFNDWWFPKAGRTEALPKRGYSLLSQPWGWVVGTGAYVDDIDAVVAEKKSDSLRRLTTSLGATSLFALLAAVVATVISVAIGRRIAKPLAHAAERTSIMASGDLTVAFDERYEKSADETGTLIRSLDTMRRDLADLIGGVVESSLRVGTGSAELQDTSTEVSNGASEQAVSTEQISAPVEEMAATIRQNAENAGEIRKLAERSGSSASEIREISAATAAAERAGATLAGLAPDIGKTAALVSEISAATAEQRAGADQIGRAMVQLDTVVQRNASASEELAASAQTLNDDAAILRATIGAFKV